MKKTMRVIESASTTGLQTASGRTVNDKPVINLGVDLDHANRDIF